MTFNSSNDLEPVVSSDGLKVAFTSDQDGDFDIYTINADGTGLFKVTNNQVNDTAPSISGNGGKIAYQSEQGSDSDIYIINSDGTRRVQLTQNTAEDVEPSISADGLWIAYVSTDDPFGSNPEKDQEIFLVKADESIRRQLTQNNYPDSSPTVSSDGSQIAFQSRVGAFFGIWIVNSDGTGLRQVTTNEGDNISPSISADGGRIAFNFCGPATASIPIVPAAIQPFQDFQCPPIPFEVMVINSDGSGLRQLSSTGGDNYSPAISGDGNWVAYVSTGDGDREIMRAKADGTVLVQITNNTIFDVDPSIDYTGENIVFASNLDGDFEIFLSTSSAVIRNLAVTQMVVLRTVGYNRIISNPLEARVTVQNQGSNIETVTVEFFIQGGPALASQTVMMAPGVSQVLTFGLNPQPLAKGNYALVARAVPLSGETDTADNTFAGSTVQVRIPGDVEGDGDVDILDAARLAFLYGKTCGAAGYSYEPDFDNDCDIDIIDAAILAFYYGTVG